MTNPEILEWIRTAPGVAMNPDGHYGLQCVDAAQQYGSDIFGVPWSAAIGGVTGAKQILDAASDDYWTRTDNDPNNPNLIPKQGDVVVFGGSAINQWGHVAIVDSADANGMWVIQQDGFAPPLQWADGAMYSAKPAHRAWLPYYGVGTGMVSGWLTPRENKIVGYKAPEPSAPSLLPTQRIASTTVKYRPEPNTNQQETKTFDAGDVLNFVGYVHGQNIKIGNIETDIWFKGTGGGYIWAGGVNGEANTAGLQDLTPTPTVTPKPTAPTANPSARTIGAEPANQRSEPKTGNNITASLDSGFTFSAKGFVHGESIDGNDIWFVGSVSGGFIHSSTCTSGPSTNGLQDLTAMPAPVITITPKPAPVPTPPVYTPPVVKDAFKGDLPCITEWIPAAEGNFEVGNFPEDISTVVVHDYGTHGRDTYETSVAHFQTSRPDAPSSAHVLISWAHITQMVKFFGPDRCRAYGSGPKGNDFLQIEVDPEIFTGSVKGEMVKANVRIFLQQLFDKYGHKMKLIEHNSLMNTLCGDDIDLAWFADIDVTPKASTPAPKSSTPAKSSLEDIAKAVEEVAKLIRNH